jgi:hypothetical protein
MTWTNLLHHKELALNLPEAKPSFRTAAVHSTIRERLAFAVIIAPLALGVTWYFIYTVLSLELYTTLTSVCVVTSMFARTAVLAWTRITGVAHFTFLAIVTAVTVTREVFLIK